ncbi:MAG: DUF2281 domain-containing protein [Methylococcaceae bacterium]|nr:DUF2281 domain-containing protein [Methylococcaceae bacterium]
MNTAELIYQKSKQLPEIVNVQILHFVEYLEEKHKLAEASQTAKQSTDVMTHLQASIKKNHRLGELL